MLAPFRLYLVVDEADEAEGGNLGGSTFIT
jgi:hypothetical protein